MKDCTPSCLMGCDLPLSDRSNPDFHTFCLNPNSRAVKAAFRACDNPLQISRKRIYGAALEQQSPACQGTGNEDRRTRKLSTPARVATPTRMMVSRSNRTILSCCKSGELAAFSLCSRSV